MACKIRFSRVKEINLKKVESLLNDYESIKEPKLLDTWLHDSFAQSFMPGVTVKDSVQVLKMLDIFGKNKTFGIYKKSQALCIWVKMQLYKDQPEYLLNLEPQLVPSRGALSERYRLFLYKKLSGENLFFDGGEHILDHVIVNSLSILKTINPNTRLQNTLRARHRYYVAHAYYLKSLHSKKRHDLEEEKYYLKKASEFGPDEADEMSSFQYDIHFLQGEKDYSFIYIDYLLSNKMQNEALKEMARTSVFNYKYFERLRDLFGQLHPQKSFSQYWNENLESVLSNAPNFKLCDFKGDSVSLAQYKGKWLLVDFWGTWCSPCLQELPAIQKFYEQMVQKYPEKVDVLTIVCKDEPKSVHKFLKQNNYTFPIVISDNLIDELYKVHGYPSKFLITPTGRSMFLPLHSNWERLVTFHILQSLTDS